ncbi:ankyrin repeat domain-containing protein 26-like isoform X5 [Peromyscus maniculatus bairdii]|uniref:ankyrin repeat domain-containing protein 26-like isoform X5 n=1 Tax=Peromyscus maniculatus bairdii TaxID=230844 RepID=UPI001C2EEF1F|nr:ankyrin repeat domain-containing protein 26-like isoform X1 [Peromyscus maniculatus bairdii]XP_042134888.1 ankyrin repeat domain-containing protein 26-like isoform X1 [Peromyscus maniculatus bairdii]XP_042134889.1 ankyrin repeat domain-containing protein 26-like isoform X1 [Peromyscus maniculatus bairdii]
MEEEFDDLTQSSETASASSRFPSPNYEDLLKLIEHLSLECKDSGSLLKIRDTVHSYKMLIQLKNSHCKALMAKLGTMENEVSGLQKKLSEAEHEKIKQEQELCNLRFALKQEVEKRKSADWVYEKIKGQLREKEEQCNKEVKMKQKLEIRVRELDVELKTVRNNLNEAIEERNGTERQLLQEQNARILQDEILANHLHKQKELKMAQEKISSQLQEALDQHIEPAQCIKKMHDCIQKLGLENCKLKATARKQAEKIEQLKENLLREILNDDLTAKLETASSKCQHLHKENQLLQQELLSMKTIQKKCEKLKKHKKKLEQEIVNLKSHMEKNMIECGQIEQYKWEIEEKTKQELVQKLKQVNLFLQTQAAYEDKLEKLRHKQNASVRTQMKLRIRDLESEFSKMKSQVDCNQIEMENYKHLYLEEVKIRKSLSNKLSKTDEKLAEVKTKLLLERKQNRASQHSTIDTRSVLESTCPRDLSNRLFIPRTFSGENVMVPTSNLWHSIETTENCKTKVLQEWEQSVTRELRQATAESGLHRTSSLKFTHM